MKQRDRSIDLMKSILTIQMIIAHIIFFFKKNGTMSSFGTYTNLIAFSGFMFTFGYVCNKAYISKYSPNLKKRLLKRFILTIIAYYISGISYTILISRTFNLETLIKIIFFQEIPKYSEFLLSFAFMYPLIYIFNKTFKKLKDKYYLILSFISVSLTLLNYHFVKIPLIGIFIGTTSFASFPIIQYSSYFLAGEYLASKNKILDKNILLISSIGFILFITYLLTFKHLPERFPPSMFWIVGGYFFVYTYFILSKCLIKYINKCKYLLSIGANSLSYLVISNIVIFTSFNILSRLKTYNLLIIIIVFILCLAYSYIYINILNILKRVR